MDGHGLTCLADEFPSCTTDGVKWTQDLSPYSYGRFDGRRQKEVQTTPGAGTDEVFPVSLTGSPVST